MTDTALRTTVEVKGRSLWSDAYRRFTHNKAAVAGFFILIFIIIACFGAPYFGLHDPEEVDWSLESLSIPPNFELGYYFGTDQNGRDLFVRTLYGGQVSLIVGFVATLVSLVIGVLYGAIAGYAGGRVDAAMMRFVDILYSLPFIFFVIILMVVFNRNFILMFIAIGAVEWLTMARIVRGQTLSLKEREFVEAAKAAGVKPLTIITRHIVPNLLGPVIVYVTLTVPAVILTESFLSFLGLGIQEPMTSWGVLISDGKDQMEAAPWLLTFPAVFMAITLFCFNFIFKNIVCCL